MLVTSRTSSWVVPPPKVVFHKDAPSACAPKGCTARARRALSDRHSVASSTGFGGGLRATGYFVAAGRKADKELAVYHAVAGWAQGGRPSESA